MQVLSALSRLCSRPHRPSATPLVPIHSADTQVSFGAVGRIHGVTLVGASGATVSMDCWEIPEERRTIRSGPGDVGTNDIWTVPGEQGLTLDEAVEAGGGALPNYHAYQLQDVIGAVREGRQPAVTGLDGYRVVAVIQGVYESTRTGRPVPLRL